MPEIVISNNLVELKTYIGPFKKYGGTMMTAFWDQHFEIFLDESLAQIKNYEISKTHEMLHLLSYINNEELNYFNHNEEFLGLDEAVTQFLAETIENDNENSYLSFLVKVVEILVNIFGIRSIINQYFKVSYDFENQFDLLTDGGFYNFGINMTNIYHLLRTQEYNMEKWNITDELKLNDAKSEMMDYISKLVNNVSKQEKGINKSGENCENIHIR